MITIRHATLAADRPEDGIDAEQWDEEHVVDGLAPVAISGSFNDLENVPADFPPSAHGHGIGAVNGLQQALDGKQPVSLALTNTTASFTAELETKLNGIDEGATANLGDVVGPAVSTDDALAGFDGLTGKALKSGLITLTEAVAMREEIAAARGDRSSLARRIDDINDFASPNVGAVVPGRYYDQSLQAANSTTVAGSANRLEMSPFLTSQRMRIDQIGVAVSTLIAGSLMRCFIYSSGEDGWPEDLIFEGGSDLSGAAAVYVAHSLDYTFDKGRKFWVGVRFSANTTVRAIPNSAMGNLGIQTSAATAYNTQLRDTLAFATPLPAVWTFAEAQLAAGNPPSIRMRAIAL